MAVLKKIKASTFMETLVATVLIVVVFMISSIILNNVFSNTIKNDKREINTRLNELTYQISHNKLLIPYEEDFKSWSVSIELQKDKNNYLISATNQKNNQQIEKHLYEN